MNGRCHNDPMDFAEDICDSCGEQFCFDCLVFPRGPKGPPYCTSCAMALSGVRNRRPAQTRSRSEIRKRRKELRGQLASRDASEKIELPGTELINGPRLDPAAAASEAASAQKSKRGLIGRLRGRTTRDQESNTGTTDPGTESFSEFGGLPPAEADVDQTEPAEPAEDGLEHGEHATNPATAERSSAAALLEQLRDHAAGTEDDVWLPPVRETSSTGWTMPDVTPLGTGGPWGALASQPATEPAPSSAAATDVAGASPPVFVSEAELRARGPADKDTAGNWVPPSLRGIAPDAHSSASALPRRRRRSAEADAETTDS